MICSTRNCFDCLILQSFREVFIDLLECCYIFSSIFDSALSEFVPTSSKKFIFSSVKKSMTFSSDNFLDNVLLKYGCINFNKYFLILLIIYTKLATIILSSCKKLLILSIDECVIVTCYY